jgi:hypothetical protein
MPKLYGKQDVGINLLGGIFQGMLDRRQRNQDLQDQEAQRQQASMMQEQRQAHGINLVEMQDEMRRTSKLETRGYEEKQNITSEKWKQYMEKNKIPYTGNWKTDKWAIDRYDDVKREKAKIRVPTGSDKPMDFPQALNLAQDLHKTATPEAHEAMANKWVESGATKRSVSAMTKDVPGLFPSGEVPQRPSTLQQQARDVQSLSVKYGHEYMGLEYVYRGLNDQVDWLEETTTQQQIASMVSTAMQTLLKDRDAYGITDEQAGNLDAMHHLSLSHVLAGVYLQGIGGQGENSDVYTEFPQNVRNEIGRRVALMGGSKDTLQDVVPDFVLAETANAAFREILGMNTPVFPSLPGVQVSLDDLLVKMFEMRLDDEQMAGIIHYIINGPPSTEPSRIEAGVKVIGGTLKDTAKKFLRVP